MPTHDVGVGIDGPGGAVDGARGKCGDVIRQRGLHLLRVCCLAVPQYEKGVAVYVHAWVSIPPAHA